MSALSAWLEVFGRAHPMLVHVPIGFVLALALIEIASVRLRARSTDIRPFVSLLVVCAAAASLTTAATGYTLHLEPGYDADAVTAHLRLGIAVAIATCAAAALHLRGRPTAYRIALALSTALVVPTGHFGSALTRGDGFLTAPLRARPSVSAPTTATVSAPQPAAPETAAQPSPPPSIPTYRSEIAPIFAARCTSCHGETKKKGGLSLADPTAIAAGGADGPVLVPGQASESEMVRRLRLPLEDEDHMPPASRAQPTSDEIAKIEAWIAAGALADSGAHDTVEKTSAARTPAPNAETTALAPADPAALDALRREFVHVEALSRDSTWLDVDFAATARDTDDARALRLLAPLRENVAELSLARSRIGDATLELCARMPHLRRLDVTATAVSDRGIAALETHPALTDLVLVRTQVTDAAVAALLRMPKLARLYLWESGVSADAIARLRSERPALLVDGGDRPPSIAIETESEVHVGKPAPSGEPAPLTPVNARCPVSGQPVDAKYSIAYRGRVIGFCCPKCPTKFWADPETYASKLE